MLPQSTACRPPSSPAAASTTPTAPPRPLLRIIPGKLHGEPHVLDTRIPSAAIYALAHAGYTPAQIREMYPEASPQAIHQAIDL